MDESSSDAPANAADALRRIVEQVPIESWQDPGMLRGRLADRGVPPSEANLLVNALQEGVPQRIRRERDDTPRAVLLGIVKNRLIEGQGMAPERAEWAARAWVDALVPQTAAGPGQPDEFVWTDAATGPPVAAPVPPVPAPKPAIKPEDAIGLVILAAMFFLVRWLDSGDAADEQEYSVTHVDVFPSEVENVPLDQLVNFASGCLVGVPLGSEGCNIILPVPDTTPFVGVDQEVMYTSVPGRGLVTVDVSCTINDPSGQTSAPVTSRGELPDPGFGTTARRPALFRTMFPRPASGWKAGRYKVTCVSPRQTVDGWFDVAARP